MQQNPRKTIFLVDDDITNLMVGESALSDLYDVATLGSAEAMLEMLAYVTPDLFLLDVSMPDMDGYDAIHIIKANPKTAGIPVVFLTALSDESAELKGFTLGAADYITKPFSPPILRKRIEVLLLVEAQKEELLLFNKNLSQLVDEKTKTVVELKNAILTTMAELVECRDEDTGSHIARTVQYLKLLLTAMKHHGVYAGEVSRIDEDLVLQSCQLHDVGKIAVRDDILLKPGKLTPEEFNEMKTHTIFGEEVILRLKKKTMDSGFVEYAGIFAVSHHEKWDGSGYPKGLAGEEIPLLGRMMAIADVYDALVSRRPYKQPFSHEKAVQIMLESKNSHFDPTLMDLFEKIHHEFEIIAAGVNNEQ